MLGLAFESNRSNCLVLILHKQMGNYMLSTVETYGLTTQHTYQILYRSMFDAYQQVDYSLSPGQCAVQHPDANLQ